LSLCLFIANIQLGLQSKAQRVFAAKEKQASTAFFAGNKNRGFFTPPTRNETSSRKSSSVFVESDGIVRSMPFGGIKEIL
jgi:hypothetical protein